MSEMMYIQAINLALREEMARDERVFVIGEDVRHSLMGTTAGLVETFGEKRVVDTPISEAGFTGLAAGAAMAGLRPVVEYEINTLPYVAMDQLANQLARLRYMTGGQLTMPVTIRVVGAGIGALGAPGMAGQHSDSPWAMLTHLGLKVVVPSTPRDVRGLLKTAVRTDDPVVLFEPVSLYATKGEVPEEEELIGLGVASVVRTGSDVTVVATGSLVGEALSAAEKAAELGISVEIIDPRTLYPLDVDTVLGSVHRTGRLVVADDDYRVSGFASEVAALAADLAFGDLRAPVRRVTRPMVPVPYAAPLLAEIAPTGAKILTEIQAAMAWHPHPVTTP